MIPPLALDVLNTSHSIARLVLLAVDDDPSLLRAIERDLRRSCSTDDRVRLADSGFVALDLSQQLRRRNETVARLLVDQSMLAMSGVGILTQALLLFPRCKRALLTADMATDAGIEFIKKAQIDCYWM